MELFLYFWLACLAAIILTVVIWLCIEYSNAIVEPDWISYGLKFVVACIGGAQFSSLLVLFWDGFRGPLLVLNFLRYVVREVSKEFLYNGMLPDTTTLMAEKLVPYVLPFMATGFLVFSALLVVDNQVTTWTKWDCRRYLDEVKSRRLTQLSRFLSGPSRKHFRKNFIATELQIPTQHSHAHSAAFRNAASYAMNDFITDAGYTVYSLSKSLREDEMDGERFMYTPRDFAMKTSCDPIGENHFIKMVDVDYYYPMDAVMLLAKPILLYTYVPLCAGYNDPDGSYVIENNYVKHSISGGGKFSHELWDWNHDFISVSEPYGDYMTRFVIYEVDQLLINPQKSDHRVVYLKPLRELVVENMMVDEVGVEPLRRHQLSKGNINYVSLINDKGVMYSVSYANTPLSVTLTAKDFLAVWARKGKSGCNFNAGDVQRIIGNQLGHDASLLAEILSDEEFDITMLKLNANNAFAPPVKRVKAINYDVAHKNLTPPKTVGREFAPSVIGLQAVAPSKCIGNDEITVQKRIVEPRNKTTPPYKYKEWAKEFLEFLVPSYKVGVGCPISIAEVMDKQSLPAQRNRSKQELPYLDTAKEFIVKAFQKNEFYPKVGAPRNISQTPTGHMLKLSSFTIPFKQEILKQTEWYMPCCSPSEIADRMMSYVAEHDSVLESDFSKFDGSLSQFLQVKIVIASYLRWVAPQYREELRNLLYKELKAVGVTEFLVFYDTGYSTLSGSAKTTDGNCEMNAFTSYAAKREAGLQPTEAWRLIGLIYGDDNVTSGKAEILNKVCQELGLKVKNAEILRDNAVHYIGRVFVNPWATTTSFQDLARTLPKLHLTMSNLTVPLTVAAYNKVCSYLVSDALTPALSNWCSLLKIVYADGANCVLSEEQKRELAKDRPYVANENNSWPQNEDDRILLLDATAESLGISPLDISAYCLELDKLASNFVDREQTLEKMRCLPTLDHTDRYVHVDLDVPVFVDDELIVPIHVDNTTTDAPRVGSVDDRSSVLNRPTSAVVFVGLDDKCKSDDPCFQELFRLAKALYLAEQVSPVPIQGTHRRAFDMGTGTVHGSARIALDSNIRRYSRSLRSPLLSGLVSNVKTKPSKPFSAPFSPINDPAPRPSYEGPLLKMQVPLPSEPVLVEESYPPSDDGAAYYDSDEDFGDEEGPLPPPWANLSHLFPEDEKEMTDEEYEFFMSLSDGVLKPKLPPAPHLKTA